jgi:hypothetical protein
MSIPAMLEHGGLVVRIRRLVGNFRSQDVRQLDTMELGKNYGGSFYEQPRLPFRGHQRERLGELSCANRRRHQQKPAHQMPISS